MGGDEFLVLVDAASDATLAELIARMEADAPSAPSGFTLGGAVRESGESLEATLRRADAELYAKRAAARGGSALEKP
jgi:predicted signal transduction protein with EAL and GGDEF domain